MIHTPNLPLSLYVHLPWCVQKCPYCDFNSHPLRGQLPEADYLAALLRDLDEELTRIENRTIDTVFFGGGTPSLFGGDSIDCILNKVGKHLAADAEVTLEANPGTVEHGAFTAYRNAGINRLSLGAQSFDNKTLKRLGRIHDASEIKQAVEEVHAAGIDNFNIDLMYGLPEQSLDGALADIEQAVALEPTHLSHYQLTLEPQTLFAKHPPPLPNDDAIWMMQTQCQSALATKGFAQYEVSAYARDGRRCRHNLNYWQYGDYLGIGAGAHSKLTIDGRIIRRAKLRQPRQYMDTAGTTSGYTENEVTRDDRAFEFMLNALRLNAGFSQAGFEQRTGRPLADIDATLKQAMDKGLLAHANGRYRPTRRGRTFLNDLQALFLPETGEAA